MNVNGPSGSKIAAIQQFVLQFCRIRIEAILSNETFYEQASHFGDLLKDDFGSSLDKAVFYVEYVMRHKGAQHLKSPAKELNWIQFFLIDVIIFTAAVLFVSLGLGYIILRICYKTIFVKSRSNLLKQKIN